METKYLLLALATATIGFIIWYSLSSSLRLPTTFQIKYDINRSYFNRILRRRLTGFLIFGLLPFLLIIKWKLLGDVRLEDLNISFSWNGRVTLWILILIPITALFRFWNFGKRAGLSAYPEIRVTLWTPYLILLSALYWVLYLTALEFLYRGLVLQSVFMATQQKATAILISTGLYAMTQYFRSGRAAVFSMPYGVVIAYATLHSGSLLPAIMVHIASVLITEWVAILKHPELQFQFSLYPATLKPKNHSS